MNQQVVLPWRLEDIDLSRAEANKVRDNEPLFFLICSSSFVESGSDLYTRNLVEHFHDDDEAELRAWLDQHWEPEELQHGRALAAYIRQVWPEFDWDAAYASFLKEYSAVCTMEELEPIRGLEMVARCVVETGTSTMYRAINALTDEPVLKQLTDNIRKDEVRHFSHFYHHFQRYRSRDKLGRFGVLRTIVARLREMKGEDSDIALRHVFYHRYPERKDDTAAFRRTADQAERLLKQNLPVEMSIKMLLKPLDLPPRMQKTLQTPLTKAAQKLFFHI